MWFEDEIFIKVPEFVESAVLRLRPIEYVPRKLEGIEAPA